MSTPLPTLINVDPQENLRWRDQTIRLLEIIILLGFMASLIYHYECIIIGRRFYPFGTFLFRPDDQFMDFINEFRVPLNPDGMWRFYVYNPFTYIILSLFARLPWLIALWLFFVSFVAGFSILAAWQLRAPSWLDTARRVIVLTWFTYPFLFGIDRANFEAYIFLLVAAFVWLYKAQKYWLSSLVLGFTLAIKPFPGVFLILLVADKRYKELVTCVLLAGLLTLFGLAFFDGGIQHNWARYSTGMSLMQSGYMLDFSDGIIFEISFWGLIKVCTKLFTPELSLAGLQDLLFEYNVIGLALLCLLAAYIRWVDTVFWRRIALLILAMNLLPPISGVYKLFHIFTILFLFLNSPQAVDSRRTWVAVLLGLLLIPKDYIHLSWITPELSIAVVVDPLLQTMLVVLLISQCRSEYASQARRPPGNAVATHA